MFSVATLSRARRRVVIPTPVCAELLTVIGPDAQQYIEIVSQSRSFEIAPFDNKCAIELAVLNRTVFSEGDKKNQLEPYQRIKIDRQIVAICKASGVEDLYTDDSGLTGRAVMCGINVIHSWDLPIPPTAIQGRLALEQHGSLPEAEA